MAVEWGLCVDSQRGGGEMPGPIVITAFPGHPGNWDWCPALQAIYSPNSLPIQCRPSMASCLHGGGAPRLTAQQLGEMTPSPTSPSWLWWLLENNNLCIKRQGGGGKKGRNTESRKSPFWGGQGPAFLSQYHEECSLDWHLSFSPPCLLLFLLISGTH